MAMAKVRKFGQVAPREGARHSLNDGIEQRRISRAICQLEANAYGPDFFQLQRRFLADEFALIPWSRPFGWCLDRVHEFPPYQMKGISLCASQMEKIDPKQPFTRILRTSARQGELLFRIRSLQAVPGQKRTFGSEQDR
jgi:hypothetical protein